MKSVAHVRETSSSSPLPPSPGSSSSACSARSDGPRRPARGPDELIGCADAAELARRAADASSNGSGRAGTRDRDAGRAHPPRMYAALRERHRRGGVDFARMRVFAVDELCRRRPPTATSGRQLTVEFLSWAAIPPAQCSRFRVEAPDLARCARGTSGPSPAPGRQSKGARLVRREWRPAGGRASPRDPRRWRWPARTPRTSPRGPALDSEPAALRGRDRATTGTPP